MKGETKKAFSAVWRTRRSSASRGWATERLYKPVIGPIMAPKPDMTAAVIFYLVSIAGTVFLAIDPALREGAWTRAALNGAVLGFVAYATYDLTNQATLSVWSWKLTLTDIAWGTTLTAASATGGFFAARWAEGRFG